MSDFLETSEHVSKVFISAVRMSRDSLDHPISELRVQLYLVYFRVLFGQCGFIFIEFLYEIEGLIRELDLSPVLVHVIEHVLEFFTPMQIPPLLLLIFVCIVELDEFKYSSIFILLNVLFILIVGEHFAFYI